MKYDILLCDLDDTLFDFHKGEAIALNSTFEHFGIPATPENLAAYHTANSEQWKKLERGETTSEKLRVDRFSGFLALAGLEGDAQALCDDYMERLGQQCWPLPFSTELIRRVSEKMPVYLVTNGIAVIQRNRLSRSEIRPYVTGVIISEEVGVSKPNPKMIYEALAQAAADDLSRAVMLGDSLTSDIAAANNAGIDSILFTNGKEIPEGHKATYAVKTLEEALALILAK